MPICRTRLSCCWWETRWWQRKVKLAALAASPGATISVDLPEQTVTLPMGAGRAEVFGFEVDPFRKDLLVRGLDEIGLTLSLAEEIALYAENRVRREPWVVPTSRET